jgi:hypothetical protein
MTDAAQILQRYKAAESVRLAMCSIWRDVGAYGDPLNRQIGMDTATVGWSPSLAGQAQIFDSTLRQAAMTYAAGCMSWITPAETKWFAYTAPRFLRGDDAAKSWYSECSDIASEVLAGTNFYSQVHDVYMQDGIYGTSGLFVRENVRYGLHFESMQISEYSILENHLGDVDTVFRVKKYSARQMADDFGEKNLPHEVAQCLGYPLKERNEDHEVIHCISERKDRDRYRKNVQNAPWASVWIHKASEKILRESGFYEPPFCVHRHLPWGRTPYGRSPGMESLYDTRTLNYMQQQLDTLVEKQVSPPVIAPANFEGTIDLRARGITYTPDMNSRPQYFGEPGNYMIGEDRTEFRKRQINNAFHVELFQALASVPIGKQMTAEEVRQRRNDRLPNFSPTFARKTREICDPIMRQVFSVLAKAGAFPPAPRQLMQNLGNGEVFIPDPNIVYSSRMALALQTIHNDAFVDAMTMAGNIANVRPDVLDNLNIDDGFRNYARNLGVLESSIVPERIRDQMRMARAQAQAQAEREMSMLDEAEGVAKLAQAAA